MHLHLALFAAAVAGDPAAADWIRAQNGSAKLDAAGHVVEASLGFAWVSDTDMERIAQLKHLRKLDLALGQIGERGLARMRAMRSVTDLTLYYSEFVADVALANLRGWKQLERLNLRGTDVTDTSLAYIGELTGLRALDLSFTQVTDNGLEHLGNLTQLEELSIGGNKVTGSGLQVLRLLPKLRSLNVNGAQKRNSGMWVTSVTDFDLGMIGSLKSLEALDLGGTKTTDLGLERLAGLTRLRELNVSRTAAGAAGLAAVSKLPVERLSLWKAAKVGDEAMTPLAAMKTLKSLDLSGTAVTDRGLETLGRSGLERLYLRETAVTAEGVDQFRRGNPKCFVSWR